MKLLAAILILTLVDTKVNSSVYEALQGERVEEINKVLANLGDEEHEASNNAYRGALLMKKAGLISGPMKKLEMFKDGHRLLEAEIKNDPQNVEYRFLRLSIQEHAPKILGYDENIEEDKLFIVSHFSTLNKEIKTHIRAYTSRSTILKSADLVG